MDSAMTPCDGFDAASAASTASSSLPIITTAFEPHDTYIADVQTPEQPKEKAEAVTESETESEVLTDDDRCVDDDDDCASVSELLATADALLDDIRAMVSDCVDAEEEEDAHNSFIAVRYGEQDVGATGTSDVSALLLRIAALEADKEHLEDEKEMCRGVAFELEALHAAAEARVTQLEGRIRQYGDQLTAAETRVVQLETTLCETNQHYSTMETRVKELKTDNASLLESADRSLGVGVKFEGLYLASLSRTTELETCLRQYDRQLSTAEARVAKLEMELCEKNQAADAAHACIAKLETDLKGFEQHHSTTEARIKELEEDKKRLQDDVELCRGVGLELESLLTAATARITELENRLKRYDHHLQAAEFRVSELETKLHQLNQNCTTAEARITELTADNESLLDELDSCRDFGFDISALHDTAQVRIAELEAGIAFKAAPTTLKPTRRAVRVAALPPKHPGPPVFASPYAW